MEAIRLMRFFSRDDHGGFDPEFLRDQFKRATANINKMTNKMTSTKVKCECISKKESKNYNQEHPIMTVIELQVPYDQNSIYFQMSGGTNFSLNTVNQHAADMFKIGSSYDILISPSQD